MIGSRWRLGILVLLAGAALAFAGWWLLPRMVAALPGRVRHYVPEAVVAVVMTPLPTALPSPAGPPAESLVLALATPTSAPKLAGSPAANRLVATPTPLIVAPQVTITAQPMMILRPYIRIDGLPIIPQKFNNCGPTNLTLVLNYYGVEVDQFDVAAVIRPNYEDRNVSPEELAGYVQRETELAADVFVGGDIDLLRRLLAAGFPVIIESGLVPDEATGWMGHYLTVIGYDDITRHFYVRDTYLGPWQGDGLVAYDEIKRAWSAFNNTFIVVFPADQSTTVEDIVGEGFRDPQRMWMETADRARQAIAADPDDAFAWFNLGTSLTQLAALSGEASAYAPAVAAFDQARRVGLPPRMLWYQFAPYTAYLAAGRYSDVVELTDVILSNQGGRNVEETYLFRGYALRELGDKVAAGEAFARTIQLNSNSGVADLARAALNTAD